MKWNRFAIMVVGLILAGVFVADLAFAREDEVERNYAIVQAVNLHANTIQLKGYEYFVTSSTELLNDVGMRARLGDFEAMEVTNDVPDRKTGSKVYFEADENHRLLKLQMVREIPG